jgi:rubrerythrin
MSEFRLADIDCDGAILDGFARLHGQSRAELLRKAALGGAALAGALVMPPPARSAAATDQDFLNFDLTFERLQASFYTEAERIGTIDRMGEEAAFWARTLGSHERAHVRILKQVLGSAAVAEPRFDFHGATDSRDEFIRTAVSMEDLTVALLAGQVGELRNRQLVSALFSLLTVEARHAAWARRIVGAQPVNESFDEPRPTAEVQGIIASTKFIASRSVTTQVSEQPRFTG